MGIWFFTSLAGGMLAVLACCRPDEVAWRFVRLIGVLALAMLCGSFAWYFRAFSWGSSPDETAGLVGLLIASLGCGVLIWLAPHLPTRRGFFLAVMAPTAGAALAAACTWAGVQDGVAPGSGAQSAMLVAGPLSSAALMGAVTVAWLLGHAYLTATRMTIAPLRRLSRILVAALAFRVLVSVAALAAAGSAAGSSELIRHWMLLSLRGGVGLVLPAVFAYMVYDCVRLRSTQSATGILYFASPFIYVGELCGLIATGELGWPM